MPLASLTSEAEILIKALFGLDDVAGMKLRDHQAQALTAAMSTGPRGPTRSSHRAPARARPSRSSCPCSPGCSSSLVSGAATRAPMPGGTTCRRGGARCAAPPGRLRFAR